MSLEEQALAEMESFLTTVEAQLKEDVRLRSQIVEEMRKWVNAQKA